MPLTRSSSGVPASSAGVSGGSVRALLDVIEERREQAGLERQAFQRFGERGLQGAARPAARPAAASASRRSAGSAPRGRSSRCRRRAPARRACGVSASSAREHFVGGRAVDDQQAADVGAPSSCRSFASCSEQWPRHRRQLARDRSATSASCRTRASRGTRRRRRRRARRPRQRGDGRHTRPSH